VVPHVGEQTVLDARPQEEQLRPRSRDKKAGPISIEELAIRVGAEAASMVQDVGAHELATSGPGYEPDYETQRP
jgi:hypothetical protein